MALSSKPESEPDKRPLASVKPIRLPDILPATRVKQATPFGNMHVKIVVNSESTREVEVFAQLGKGGDIANSDLEAICRLTSLYLRVGGDIGDIVGQLEGIGSSLSVPTKDGRVTSLADGLAKAIRKYGRARDAEVREAVLPGEATAAKHQAEATWSPNCTNVFKVRCPECGAALVFQESCMKCPACAFAQC